MAAAEEDVIDLFYQAVTAPEVWPLAIERLQAMFGSEAAILGVFDPAAHDLSLSFSTGAWSAPVMDRYAREFVKVDPAPAKFARVPAGKAVTTEALIPEAERRDSIFYNEFLRPLGLQDCLGARLLDIDGGFSALAVHRGQKRQAFAPSEAALFERIVPHATRAFQLYRAFALLNLKATLLASVVDRLTVGLIASDREGRPVHINARALALIARKDGLWQEANGQLRAANRAVDKRLAQLQQAVRKGGAGGIVRAPRDHGTLAYPVLVAPLPAGTGLAGAIGEGRSGMLLLIHDPDSQTPTMAQTLAAMFGLTPRGAELAAALTAGDDLKDYAERAGISLHTARFHLKGVFAALGVRSQAQLIRRTIRALAEFSLGRNGTA